jgi:predicted ATPase
MGLYVITGGPGVGKTTICNELAARGYTTLPEAARHIIASEQMKPAGKLPWTDFEGFQHLVLDHIESLESCVEGDAFCDRGALDAIAYHHDIGIAPCERLDALVQAERFQKRYEKVFVLDRLPTYTRDEQRLEDEPKAIRLHTLIRRAYLNCGYEVINVPVLEPAARAQYIIDRLHTDTSTRLAPARAYKR